MKRKIVLRNKRKHIQIRRGWNPHPSPIRAGIKSLKNLMHKLHLDDTVVVQYLDGLKNETTFNFGIIKKHRYSKTGNRSIVSNEFVSIPMVLNTQKYPGFVKNTDQTLEVCLHSRKRFT